MSTNLEDCKVDLNPPDSLQNDYASTSANYGDKIVVSRGANEKEVDDQNFTKPNPNGFFTETKSEKA